MIIHKWWTIHGATSKIGLLWPGMVLLLLVSVAQECDCLSQGEDHCDEH